jgi:hypothetical protein
MTLSILMYALMLCSFAALTVLLVGDGVRGHVTRLRPLDIAAPASPCVPGRTRHASIGSPMSHASRGHGTAGRRRR